MFAPGSNVRELPHEPWKLSVCGELRSEYEDPGEVEEHKDREERVKEWKDDEACQIRVQEYDEQVAEDEGASAWLDVCSGHGLICCVRGMVFLFSTI
jgi:hypothetical protein